MECGQSPNDAVSREVIAPAVFIVGAPRSGTTLLRLMLDSHPQLAILPETHFLFQLLGPGASPVQSAREFCDLIVGHFTWSDFDLDEHEFRKAADAITPFSLTAGLRTFFSSYAGRFGKTLWGEKTPDYGSIMAAIQNCLPEARFLHLIRDGRDVAVSKRSLWFGPGESIRNQAVNWVRNVATTRGQAGDCSHYLEIRFEDLISSPEVTLRKICAFLDLPYHKAMLKYHKRANKRLAELKGWSTPHVTRAQFRFLHKNTSRRLRRDRIGIWKKKLAADEVSRFEEIAGDTLVSCGYPLATARGNSSPGANGVVRRRAILSCVLMMKELTSESAGWFESMHTFCDELVVFLDIKAVDSASRRRARRIATRVYEIESEGFIEAHLEDMFRACRGDWILRLDSDEQFIRNWSSDRWRSLLDSNEFTHISCPRRWLHPGGGFIHAAPWWPDWQVRLVRNDPAAISFPKHVHETITVSGQCGYFPDLMIDHHVLQWKSRAEREAKVRGYEEKRSARSPKFYYLYEDFSPPVAPLAASHHDTGGAPIAPMHPILEEEARRVQLKAASIPDKVEAGKMFWVPVSLTNDSARELSSMLPNPVSLAYHWIDAVSGVTVLFDGRRTPLHPRIGPDSLKKFLALVIAPSEPGEYVLQLTAVQEFVRWFEEVNPAIVCEQGILVVPNR